jgi:hypothetical protein
MNLKDVYFLLSIKFLLLQSNELSIFETDLVFLYQTKILTVLPEAEGHREVLGLELVPPAQETELVWSPRLGNNCFSNSNNYCSAVVTNHRNYHHETTVIHTIFQRSVKVAVRRKMLTTLTAVVTMCTTLLLVTNLTCDVNNDVSVYKTNICYFVASILKPINVRIVTEVSECKGEVFTILS